VVVDRAQVALAPMDEEQAWTPFGNVQGCQAVDVTKSCDRWGEEIMVAGEGDQRVGDAREVWRAQIAVRLDPFEQFP
jgi:hypothetical protein